MALPGVKTVLRDRPYMLSRTDFPETTRLAVIAPRGSVAAGATLESGGTAAKDYSPYRAFNERAVIENFGGGSGCHRAYIEAVAGGAAHITLIPVPYMVDPDGDGPGAARPITDTDLQNTADGSIFDLAFNAAEVARAEIIALWGRGGIASDEAFTDVTVDITANTFGATGHGLTAGTPVVFAATTAPGGITLGSVYYVIAPTANAFAVSTTVGGTAVDVTSTGTAVRVRRHVPVGFYADSGNTTGTSLAKAVADRCAMITDRSQPCFAIMGVAPLPGSDRPTPAELAAHVNLNNLINNENQTTGDNGGYLSVVLAELDIAANSKIYSRDTYGWANGAVTYAGYLSSLPSSSAPTGKIAYNVAALRYVPTRPQQEGVIAKGVVPVGQNFLDQATWIDGLTFARKGSDFTRLSTLRIVFDAVQLIRRTSERFIGEPATMHHRNSLETAITTSLRGMIVQGALLDANFEITYHAAESKAVIDLVLTPAFELRNIEISVSVQL